MLCVSLMSECFCFWMRSRLVSESLFSTSRRTHSLNASDLRSVEADRGGQSHLTLHASMSTCYHVTEVMWRHLSTQDHEMWLKACSVKFSSDYFLLRLKSLDSFLLLTTDMMQWWCWLKVVHHSNSKWAGSEPEITESNQTELSRIWTEFGSDPLLCELIREHRVLSELRHCLLWEEWWELPALLFLYFRADSGPDSASVRSLPKHHLQSLIHNRTQEELLFHSHSGGK